MWRRIAQVLEELDAEKRLNKALLLIKKELELGKLQQEIQQQVGRARQAARQAGQGSAPSDLVAPPDSAHAQDGERCRRPV